MCFYKDNNNSYRVGCLLSIDDDLTTVAVYSGTQTGPWKVITKPNGKHFTQQLPTSLIREYGLFNLTSTGKLPTKFKDLVLSKGGYSGMAWGATAPPVVRLKKGWKLAKMTIFPILSVQILSQGGYNHLFFKEFFICKSMEIWQICFSFILWPRI